MVSKWSRPESFDHSAACDKKPKRQQQLTSRGDTPARNSGLAARGRPWKSPGPLDDSGCEARHSAGGQTRKPPKVSSLHHFRFVQHRDQSTQTTSGCETSVHQRDRPSFGESDEGSSASRGTVPGVRLGGVTCLAGRQGGGCSKCLLAWLQQLQQRKATIGRRGRSQENGREGRPESRRGPEPREAQGRPPFD